MTRATIEIYKSPAIIFRQGALIKRIYVLALYLHATPAITNQVNDNYLATTLSYYFGLTGGKI